MFQFRVGLHLSPGWGGGGGGKEGERGEGKSEGGRVPDLPFMISVISS